MVLLLLKIKAELENLTNLAPESPDFTFYFKIKCGSCGAVSDKRSGVSAVDKVDIPRSRGTANLVQKCKVCDRVGTIAMVEGKGKPYTVEDSEAGRFVPLQCFDCRGIEPIDFSPGNSSWSAQGVSGGSSFGDMDLSEGEFADYDEKASASVGVYKMEHTFETTKL